MTTPECVRLQEMTDDQFKAHVLQILSRELGTDGFARFLRVSKGDGREGRDFTRDRHQWQKGLTVREIVADIEKQRAFSGTT